MHTATGSNQSWAIGCDGSDDAQHAAVWAAHLASGRASGLRLVSAWSMPTGAYYAIAGAYPANLNHDLEQLARERTDELAETLKPLTDVPITTEIVHGPSAGSLLDVGRRSAMVVVGRRGLGGFSRLLLGSTSSQVATHAVVPTAVIPAETESRTADRIVVGFDNSDRSRAALDWAIDFAPAGGHVRCIMVWELVFGSVSELRAVRANWDAARDRLQRSIEQRLHDSGKEIEFTVESIEGSPRNELRSAADNADLLVMGARGRGAISSVMLGSVSTWLLHHVDTPMVIVPAPEEDDE